MKRFYLTTIVICLLMLLGFSFYYHIWDQRPESTAIRVGFLSENDEMTTNTYNFMQTRVILEKEFPGQTELLTRTNVQQGETAAALQELIRSGCSIIFTNTHSDEVRTVAAEYPDVQFCQLSDGVPAATKESGNYHTFNAKVYQGHYISGAAAGMKLREMIDTGEITAEQALIGYVGSTASAEVISGFTAFLLGARSEAPEAVMRVRYANALSNFNLEKTAANQLIEEGCVIIAQNSGTTGPAAACQEASADRIVYYIGYNETPVDDASAVTLLSFRSNWDPYVASAIRSVMQNQPIEKELMAEIRGNDACAGFDQDWLEIISINDNITAEGTTEKINRLIDEFKRGKVDVFRGDYTGVNPDNMRIRIDLNEGFTENSTSSKPTFRYILRDVITVEK